MLAVL
jgi:glucosamine--fructose-6-phosphate aminotransferase (isomerizing)